MFVYCHFGKTGGIWGQLVQIDSLTHIHCETEWELTVKKCGCCRFGCVLFFFTSGCILQNLILYVNNLTRERVSVDFDIYRPNRPKVHFKIAQSSVFSGLFSFSFVLIYKKRRSYSSLNWVKTMYKMLYIYVYWMVISNNVNRANPNFQS